MAPRPRWIQPLAALVHRDHRDEVVLDLLDERALQVARGHSRAYAAAWLAAHLLRSAVASRRPFRGARGLELDASGSKARLAIAIASTWDDLRTGARVLRHAPGFAAMSAAVLGLGLGANTAVFSLVNALLLRPLPVRAPSELTFVYPAQFNGGTVVSYDEMVSYRSDRTVIGEVAAMNEDVAGVGQAGDVQWLTGEDVTSNYFDLLGVRPRIGRGFSPAIDDAAETAAVMIISDRLWRSRFQSDPGIIGRTIRLRAPSFAGSGWPYTVIGVMGPDFTGVASPWSPTTFWAPMLQRYRDVHQTLASVMPTIDPRPRIGLMIFRRVPGASTERVQHLVTARHLNFEHTSGPRTIRTAAPRPLVALDSRRFSLPLDDRNRISPSHLASALIMLASLVLFIAVSNLAGIGVARGIVRRSEIAVRLSLGATRRRIARQLVTEGLLLSAIGGLVGILCSRALIGAFLSTLPGAFGTQQILTASLDVPVDARVLAFTIVLIGIVGIATGLAPVRQAFDVDLVAALANAAPAPGRVRHRLRHWILVPQVAIGTALLVAGCVSAEALLKVALVDLGYTHDGVTTAVLTLPPVRTSLAIESPTQRAAANGAADEKMVAFMHDVLERVETLPGVAAAGYGPLPTSGGMTFAAAARDPAGHVRAESQVFSAGVTPGYFTVLNLPVLAGRGFERRDLRDPQVLPSVAIVDESAARRLWPGQPAVGQFIGVHDHDVRAWVWLEVVGVVGDVRLPLSNGETRPSIYLPRTRSDLMAARLLIRTRGNDVELMKSVNALAAGLNPDATVSQTRSLADVVDEVRYPRRVAAVLLVSSAAVGLLMAALGLYGVVSYAVAQRLKELGIRAALGATRGDLVALVMRDGAAVTIVGCSLGLVAAFAGIRIVSHQVFAMPTMDVATLTVVPVVLGAVIGAACYLPARRAGRVDPMVVLRWL